jgi:hypothetical protein
MRLHDFQHVLHRTWDQNGAEKPVFRLVKSRRVLHVFLALDLIVIVLFGLS